MHVLLLQAREESPIRTTGQLLAALGLKVGNQGSLKALLFQVHCCRKFIGANYI